MRYTQLRAFHAVACEGSFSKAAERLLLTQPALSVQVRALEQTYGVQLFDRTGSVVRLTPLGRSLFALTHKFHDIENEAQELLAASQRLETGQLRLAAGGPYVVIGLIAEFARRYPKIEIVVSFGNTDQVWRELLERQADVVVLTGAPEDERTFAIPVAHQRIVVIMPRDHHLECWELSTGTKTSRYIKHLGWWPVLSGTPHVPIAQTPPVPREAGGATSSKPEGHPSTI